MVLIFLEADKLADFACGFDGDFLVMEPSISCCFAMHLGVLAANFLQITAQDLQEKYIARVNVLYSFILQEKYIFFFFVKQKK